MSGGVWAPRARRQISPQIALQEPTPNAHFVVISSALNLQRLGMRVLKLSANRDHLRLRLRLISPQETHPEQHNQKD